MVRKSRACASFRPGVRLDPIERREGRAGQQVEVAAEQRGEARLGIGDRGVLDPIEVVGIALEAPPVGVADHDRSPVGLELLQDKRPGAVRVPRREVLLARVDVDWNRGVVRLGPAFRHDVDGAHLIPQLRVREFGLDAHGVIVDRAHLRDALDAAGQETGQASGKIGLGPCDAEHDVCGGERRAVVETDVPAQLELPGGRIDQPPRQGQPGHDLQVGINPDQALVDLSELGEGGPLIEAMGVDGRRAADARPAQHVFRSGRRRPRGGKSKNQTGNTRSQLVHRRPSIALRHLIEANHGRHYSGYPPCRPFLAYSRAMLGSQVASCGTAMISSRNATMPQRNGQFAPNTRS